MWRRGLVDTDVLAALGRGLSPLEHRTSTRIVDAVADELPRLSVAGVTLIVQRALDLLHPNDREAAEQTDYDRRGVWFSQHGGMTMMAADLPGMEGEAVAAALDALAQSLRVEGDGLTGGQPRADALITLVNRAAAHGDVPATAGGLPVAMTVTVRAAEADRVAAGLPRDQVRDLESQVREGADPASLGVTRTSVAGTTLGDACVRFALCAGTWTGVLIDDRHRQDLPISTALAGTRTQPLAVGRSIRLANTAQRLALAVRDGGCLLGQRPPAECQTHHVTPRAQGGRTDVDSLVLLCWVHHRQVDLNRWQITRATDPDPGAPFWRVTPVPRERWRSRPAA